MKTSRGLNYNCVRRKKPHKKKRQKKSCGMTKNQTATETTVQEKEQSITYIKKITFFYSTPVFRITENYLIDR